MILDTIRAKYPHLGIAVFAMEAGQPVTVETYLGEEVYSFTGPTVEAALARAFPDLTEAGKPTSPAEDEPVEPAASVFD